MMQGMLHLLWGTSSSSLPDPAAAGSSSNRPPPPPPATPSPTTAATTDEAASSLLGAISGVRYSRVTTPGQGFVEDGRTPPTSALLSGVTVAVAVAAEADARAGEWPLLPPQQSASASAAAAAAPADGGSDVSPVSIDHPPLLSDISRDEEDEEDDEEGDGDGDAAADALSELEYSLATTTLSPVAAAAAIAAMAASATSITLSKDASPSPVTATTASSSPAQGAKEEAEEAAAAPQQQPLPAAPPAYPGSILVIPASAGALPPRDMRARPPRRLTQRNTGRRLVPHGGGVGGWTPQGCGCWLDKERLLVPIRRGGVCKLQAAPAARGKAGTAGGAAGGAGAASSLPPKGQAASEVAGKKSGSGGAAAAAGKLVTGVQVVTPRCFLSPCEMHMVVEALPSHLRWTRWHHVYSTEENGFLLSTLRGRVESVGGEIVMLVRTTDDDRFGCLLSGKPDWVHPGKPCGTGETFVFRFVEGRFEPHHWCPREDASGTELGGDPHCFVSTMSDGSIVVGGDGTGLPAILIDSELKEGRTGECCTFGSPPLLASYDRAVAAAAGAAAGGGAGPSHQHEARFSVAELEIWAFETPENEEMLAGLAPQAMHCASAGARRGSASTPLLGRLGGGRRGGFRSGSEQGPAVRVDSAAAPQCSSSRNDLYSPISGCHYVTAGQVASGSPAFDQSLLFDLGDEDDVCGWHLSDPEHHFCCVHES